MVGRTSELRSRLTERRVEGKEGRTEAKEEGEDESQEGGARAGAPFSAGQLEAKGPAAATLPGSRRSQSVTVLCCSPTSGEVNMSAGGIVSKAVHREPLGDVNRIEPQGTKVEVLKCL